MKASGLVSRLTPEALLDQFVQVGRNGAPGLLFDRYWSGKVDAGVLRAVLPGVWSGVEWPERAVARSVWVHWFDLAAYPKPETPLTLYRGARPRYARGMAWSRDGEKALWFARRWASTGNVVHVYAVEAPPEAVLADIDALEPDGRHESEVVVNPALLPKLQRAVEYDPAWRSWWEA